MDTGHWGVQISHNLIDKSLTQNLYTCRFCGYKYKDYPDRPVKGECPECKAIMIEEEGEIWGLGK